MNFSRNIILQLYTVTLKLKGGESFLNNSIWTVRQYRIIKWHQSSSFGYIDREIMEVVYTELRVCAALRWLEIKLAAYLISKSTA